MDKNLGDTVLLVTKDMYEYININLKDQCREIVTAGQRSTVNVFSSKGIEPPDWLFSKSCPAPRLDKL